MGAEWIAIGLVEVAGIALAFVLGFGARAIGLPPLVGFLIAGFVLNSQGVSDNELIPRLADLGITLLLFTVGLKLNLRSLARPHVWAVAGIHMALIVGAFGIAIFTLSFSGLGAFSGLSMATSLLVAFALSFSSTVFAVKVLEERSETASLHGRISIGILLIQDIAAVVFLAISVGQTPSPWALLLVALWPARRILHALLDHLGHGELLVLFGFLLALSGAETFELIGLKGDLGALIFGLLVATHPKADELAKTMLGFKDLFLVGFFVSIGLSEPISAGAVLVGLALTPLIFLKSALFFGLLTRFSLRARTSLRASLNLTTYSEFGLIVAAIGVSSGWIDGEWLVILAVAMSLSFGIVGALSRFAEQIYMRRRSIWCRFQKDVLASEDRLFDLEGAKVVVIGMGGVGSGAYDALDQQLGGGVVGIDIDSVTVGNQRTTGRRVLRGDPTDSDFWDRIEESHSLELVMLALPRHSTSLAVLDRLTELNYKGRVAAVARFPDDAEDLRTAGAHSVFNMYSEAGAGFVAHVMRELPSSDSELRV